MKRIVTFGIVTLILLGFTTSMIVFAQKDTVDEVKTNTQNSAIAEQSPDQEDFSNPDLQLAFNTEAIDTRIQAQKAESARLEEEKREQERLAELQKQRAATQAAQASQLRAQSTTPAPTSASTTTPAPTSNPTPAPTGDGLDHWSGRLSYWCGVYGCNAAALTEVVRCESGGKQSSYNSVGPYIGIFQFLSSTFYANAARLNIAGADVYNGEHQVQTAAWMFSKGQAGQWPACSARAGLL